MNLFVAAAAMMLWNCTYAMTDAEIASALQQKRPQKLLAQGSVCRSEARISEEACYLLKSAREVQIVGESELRYWMRVRFVDSGDEELMLKGALFLYDPSKLNGTRQQLFLRKNAIRCVAVNSLNFDKSGELPRSCSRNTFEEAVTVKGDAPAPGWVVVSEYIKRFNQWSDVYYAKEDLVTRTVYEKAAEKFVPSHAYCTTLLEKCDDKPTRTLQKACLDAAKRIGCT